MSPLLPGLLLLGSWAATALFVGLAISESRRFLWPAAFTSWLASFLGSWSFGLYTLAATFVLVALAILESFGIPAASVEGYLLPETYTLARGLSAAEILQVMVDRFFAKLRHIPETKNLSAEAIHDLVTLASMVEREAANPSEVERIAGVFKNRLDDNLRLESCATIQYILGKVKKRLTYKDLRIESPYNTYLYEGLPPGPIASPGMRALRAVLKPEKHDYLFFVARRDGTRRHVFTSTFAAHQAAIRRVKRGL